MAKTYTMPASALTAYRGTGNTLSAQTSPDAYIAGYTDTYYYGTGARFDLSAIDADAVTGLKVTVERVKGGSDIGYTVALYQSVPTGDISSTARTGYTVIMTNRDAISFTSGSGTSYEKTFSLDAACYQDLSEYGYLIYFRNQQRTIHIGSITLTVTTDETDYSLTFDGNGGSGVPGAVTATGRGSAEAVIPQGCPVRNGYIFLGWARTANASEATYAAGDAVTVTADTVLYAVWTPEQYEISFDANGGSGGPERAFKTYGVTLTLPETVPQRYGYAFAGWLSADGETVYAAGDSYHKNGAAVLTAVWTPAEVTVTWDWETGTEKVARCFDTAYGEPPAAERYGYELTGWQLADGTPVTAESMIGLAEDHTVTAVWTPLEMTLTLLGNGGMTADGLETVTQPLTMGMDFICPGERFYLIGHQQTCWNDAADGTGNFYLYDLTYTCGGELTLYAVYVPVTVTLTLDAAGGSCSVESVQAVYGEAIGTLPVPVREGYRFLGWRDAAGNSITAETESAYCEDGILTALWEKRSEAATVPCRAYVMRSGRVLSVRGRLYLGIGVEEQS